MTTQFGCARCYGDDAEAALAHLRGGGLQMDFRVVDDSHFGVSLGHCSACSQAFLSIFTEFVDWEGGDDAQYWDVVPVTPAEAASIREPDRSQDLRYLGSLGEGRRRLSSDWPTGAPRRISWRFGTFWVEPG
jgi:hypothetical protein